MNRSLSVVFLLSFAAQAQEKAGFGLSFRDLPDLPREGRFTGITAINDAGDMLVSTGGGSRLITADGVTTDLGDRTSGIDLNNRRQILVSRNGYFLRQPDGTLEPRTVPGAERVGARSLNSLGEIAGFADLKPVLWDAAGKARTIDTPFGFGLPVPQEAWGINDSGTILGSFPAGSGPHRVFRMTAEGAFTEIGQSGRAPLAMQLSNDGFYVLSYETTVAITSLLSDIDGNPAFVSSTSLFAPDGATPQFRTISPNGRLIAGQRVSGQNYVAERCPTTVSPPEADVELQGGRLRFSVTAADDCEWWFTGGTRMRGSHEIEISVNSSPAERTTRLTIAGAIVPIRQGGGACEYSFPGGTVFLVPGTGGQVRVPIVTEPRCRWSVMGLIAGITADPAFGTGPGATTLTVGPAEPGRRRNFLLGIGSAVVLIEQQPNTCTYQVTVPATLAAGSGAARVNVTTGAGCPWSVTTDASWIRANQGILAYDANPSPQPRAAELRIAGQRHQITQQPFSKGAPLLVEPANAANSRQIFRFTFSEPLTESRITIGTACTIDYRLGFRPFSVEGSCQINQASVTSAAGEFRTIELDLTLGELGPIAISAGGLPLGVFIGAGRVPAEPRTTQPAPVSATTAPSGRLLVDSNSGIGGTFRMALPVSARGVAAAMLGFERGNGPACQIYLDVASKRLSLVGAAGTVEQGRPESIGNDQCVVRGEPGSFTVDQASSRAIWDVTVFFRSAWAGRTMTTLSVLPQYEVVRILGLDSYFVEPLVSPPSLAIGPGLARVGFSSYLPLNGARVRLGSCLFTIDPVRGLEAGPAQPCRLDPSRSSVSFSGNDLTLVLAYSGDPTASGNRAIMAEATSDRAVASGWFGLGNFDQK